MVRVLVSLLTTVLPSGKHLHLGSGKVSLFRTHSWSSISPSQISRNFNFHGDIAMAAMPFVTEVILRSDTDPLVEGR